MANHEQLELLKRSIRAWNRWRKETLREIDLYRADLRGAWLFEANLNEANLAEANLEEAQLIGATLSRSDLSKANLRESYLARADMISSNFIEADLEGAELIDANLGWSDFSDSNLACTDLYATKFFKTKLDGANLSEAGLGLTIFAGIDLSKTKGLGQVIHRTSSTLGIDTLQLSRGKLPISFLRGCGLSDLDIEYAKLANPNFSSEQAIDITHKIQRLYLDKGFEYYSCFISYSSKDQEFAKHLHDNLQNNGVRCWFAPEDMKIGEEIRPTIDSQIRLRDKLLVILSKHSIKSEWVGDEVEAALEEESKSKRLVLFPIRLDDTVMKTRDDWAAKIKRRRHIGDFSNWKDKNSYQKAFKRLLRDLKAID